MSNIVLTPEEREENERRANDPYYKLLEEQERTKVCHRCSRSLAFMGTWSFIKDNRGYYWCKECASKKLGE